MFSDKRFCQLAELQQSVQYDPSRWQDTPLPSNGLAGFLSDVKVRVANTSRQAYAKARLEDPERSVSLIIWPKAYEAARSWVEENRPVVVWGRVQIPETADTPEDAWNGMEVVADRVMEYAGPPAQAGPRRAAPANAKSARPAPPAPVKGPEAPSCGQAITWEIDLARATQVDLQRLAETLQQAEGNQEIRMLLREVSGQLKQVRVNSRFFVSRDTARRLAQEFPFITPH